MAINVYHIHNTITDVIFEDKDGMTARYVDCGNIDDITERATNFMVKHDFSTVDVTSQETGEILVIIERT